MNTPRLPSKIQALNSRVCIAVTTKRIWHLAWDTAQIKNLLFKTFDLSVVKKYEFLRQDSHRRYSRQTRSAATQYHSSTFGNWRGFYTEAALNFAVIYFLGY